MAEDTLQKGKKQHTPATIEPNNVEEAAPDVEGEPEVEDFTMEDIFETQDDILERQVALSIPIGRKIG
jgi:hypothetical protein